MLVSVGKADVLQICFWLAAKELPRVQFSQNLISLVKWGTAHAKTHISKICLAGVDIKCIGEAMYPLQKLHCFEQDGTNIFIVICKLFASPPYPWIHPIFQRWKSRRICILKLRVVWDIYAACKRATIQNLEGYSIFLILLYNFWSYKAYELFRNVFQKTIISIGICVVWEYTFPFPSLMTCCVAGFYERRENIRGVTITFLVSSECITWVEAERPEIPQERL